MELARPFRPARPEDADVLAQLVNFAGEGLPYYLWGKMASPGEDAWSVGRQRALRDTGAFSFRNATIAEHDGAAAGALIGYEIGRKAEPIAEDTPALFVPLQELENLALDTWYVNVLAVLPEFRGIGLGGKLLDLADKFGAAAGRAGMSVIVHDTNTGARRLYERHGYHEIARREIVKQDWRAEGKEWLLLTKAI